MGGLVGFLVYLALFLRATPLRRSVLPFLFAPDALAAMWVDNDWSRFGPGDHLPVLGGAALIVGCCWLTGQVALRAMGLVPVLDRLERAVLGTAVGLNAWSLLTLAVGLCGALRQTWLYALAALAVAVSAAGQVLAFRNRASREADWEGRESRGAPRDALHRLAVALCLPFAVVIVWGATQPPTYFDVREYHLQVPKEWFQEGRVTFLPHNVYGNMPLGAEMHAILGMALVPGPRAWWWGSLIGKTVIATMAPLGAVGLYAVGRRFFSPAAGAVAALVYLSTPWVAHVSMNGLIDGASALFLLLAVSTVLRRSPGKAHDAAWVSLCGFLVGAAIACKYPAVLFLALPMGVWIGWLQFRRLDLRATTIYSLAVLAGCGLWFGKNWVLAGNPTYPLLYRWFDGASWTSEQDARWTKAHGPPREGDGPYTLGHLWASARELALTSESLSPALWPLALLGCCVPVDRRPLRLAGGLMLWTVAAWWLLTHRVDRFLVPLLPLAALYAGVGAAWQPIKIWRRAVAAVLVVSSLFCFVFDAIVVSDHRFFVSLAGLQNDIHPAHRYLNQHVRPGYRALMVGEAQVWDIAVPVLYNTCFDDCGLELLLRDRTRDERLAELRAHRISHIYVSWHELDRYRSPGNYGFSPFATRERVRGELVGEQALLRPVPLELDREHGEVFEVIGWENWE